MKIFVTLWQFLVLVKSIVVDDESLRIKVIKEVSEEIFQRKEFDLLTLGKVSSTVNDTIDSFLESFHQPIKTVNVDHLNDLTGNALVFSTRLAVLSKHLDETSSRILFIIKQFNEVKLMKYLSFLETIKANQIYGKFFLIESDKSYSLKTYWTEKACEKNQFISLNEFNKNTQKWAKPLDIKDTLNFHGCPLALKFNIYQLVTIDLIKASGYSGIHPGIEETLQKRDAKEKEILQIFSQVFNTQPIENMPANYIWVRQSNAALVTQLKCSFSVFDLNLKFMYSPSEPYTNYEKMFLPFDDQIWFYLILVFCSAFIGIFIINRMPKIFRDLVYGNNVKMPSFNVVGTLFGIGQTKLPDNNFGRIILMSFILFCLVFRTAYQGVFFDMFTNDLRWPPPKTCADLKERNYTIYNSKTSELNYRRLFCMDSVRPTVKDVSVLEIYQIFESLSNPQSKAAIPTSEDDLKVIKAYKSFPRILEEGTFFESQPICIDPDNFFAPTVVRILNDLITGGIIQYWYDYLMNFELRPLLDPPREPSIFGVEDLKFGFFVWLSACGISFAIFLIEIFYVLVKVNLKIFLRRYSGLFGLLYFFER